MIRDTSTLDAFAARSPGGACSLAALRTALRSGGLEAEVGDV